MKKKSKNSKTETITENPSKLYNPC